MDIHHAMIVRCLPGKVYQALTRQEQLAIWMGVPTQAQPQIGYKIEFHYAEGRRILAVEITRLEPGKQVQWRVIQPVWEAEAVNQRVTWTLEPFEESTLVDCVMDGWAAEDVAYPSVSFKWATFMVRLKIFLGDLREFTNYSPLPGLQVSA